jgi:hypothetical protein
VIGMMVWVPLDSGGFGSAIGTVAAIGFIVGLVWLRRIANLDEDPDRSFTRLSGRRGGGSRLPDAPGIPTGRWVLTRGAIVIGLGAIAFAVVGPQIMRRWNPAFEAGGIANPDLDPRHPRGRGRHRVDDPDRRSRA